MYRIEKTKNWVAQAFMNFDDEDALGVIKPHGIHERDFNFHPKMSGKFQEVLKIKNLQDPLHVVEITVKALVRKRETFQISPPTLAFGRYVIGVMSRLYESCLSCTVCDRCHVSLV